MSGSWTPRFSTQALKNFSKGERCTNFYLSGGKKNSLKIGLPKTPIPSIVFRVVGFCNFFPRRADRLKIPEFVGKNCNNSLQKPKRKQPYFDAPPQKGGRRRYTAYCKARSIRAKQDSRPKMAKASNIPNPTVAPVTAARTA